MRIAIIGAGAIGGYLAVKLARAGNDVCCIARGRQLAAIRARGLSLIEAGNGELAAPEIRGYERPAEAGPQDLIFLTLKAHQVAAIAAFRALIPVVSLPTMSMPTASWGVLYIRPLSCLNRALSG
jgi:2-dehydropantoate 2-reductase